MVIITVHALKKRDWFHGDQSAQGAHFLSRCPASIIAELAHDSTSVPEDISRQRNGPACSIPR